MLVVPMHPFSLVCVWIYKRSFTSESAVPVRLIQVQFESTEWLTSFETGASEEDVVNEDPRNTVLKARLRQSPLERSVQ